LTLFKSFGLGILLSFFTNSFRMKYFSTALMAKMSMGMLLWLAIAPTPAHAHTTPPHLTPNEIAMRVTGKVTDENGDGLPGVTVSVKGTNTGTVTDVNGSYTVEVVPNGTLVFSYTGYETSERNVGNANVMDVKLTPSANTLEDLVVIGYGSVRKSDLTAAVATVKSADIKAMPVTSVDQAISGRAPGVNITQASGAPGGGVTVRVRGPNSISSGSEPLYVIDGIPIFSYNENYSAGGNRTASNALATINPNDIESVEVLKDASGTAIYGSRGANGVILITTKRGKAGATRIDYDGSQGIQTIAKKLEMMNATEYAEYQNARARSRNQSEPYPNPASLGEGVNWQDETMRNGAVMNHNLTFSGGNDRVTFLFAPGYFRNDGIVKNTDFERYSLRVNVEARFLNDRVRIGTNSVLARTLSNAIPTDRGGPGGAIITILGQSPIGPVFGADGNYDLQSYDGRFPTNPLAEVEEVIDRDKGMRYLSNNYVNFELAKGLNFRTSFGLDLYGANRETWYSRETRLGRERNRSYELQQRNVLNYINENILSYTKEFANSRLDAVAGYTYQTDDNRTFGIVSNDFITDDLETSRLNGGVKPQLPTSGRLNWVLRSMLGRVNYSLRDKYLFTVSLRRDGSSRFGANNKWANNPSAAVAWRIKEESFLKNVDEISNMKVRVSYGITGNSEIPPYRSASELAGGQNYLIGGELVPGGSIIRIGNSDLKWEGTKMLNFGLDFGVLNNRLNFTADYFRNQTRDLLLESTLAPSSGYRTLLNNAGELENRGFELSVNALAIQKRDFSLNIGANLATLKNEVISLAGTAPFYSYTVSHLGPEGSYIAEGLPIGGWYGFDAIGIWQSQAEIDGNPNLGGIDKPGYVRYADVNGDGTINNSDRIPLGDPNPDITWGLNTSLNFNGLDFNIFFRGAHGHQIRNLQASEHADGVGNYNQYKIVATDSWSPSNPGGSRPVVDATREFPSYFRRSNFFIEDGDFVRLQNMTIGYTLKNIKNVRSLRVFLSGQNLALWTKYSGFDPEVSNGGQSQLNRGDDYDAYPRARTYNLGVQLGL
jgi:TonB-dependent starch-binding outer membrane protein SusC